MNRITLGLFITAGYCVNEFVLNIQATPISLLLVIGSLITLAVLSFKYKEAVIQEMIIAALISMAWVVISGIYVYKGTNYLFYNVNLFPFVLWTLGLVILREIYEKLKSEKNAFFKSVGIYWGLLIVIEYVGYNIMGIQLNAGNPGLFGLSLMHLPSFAQIYYLSIGPIYLLLTDYLKVK